VFVDVGDHFVAAGGYVQLKQRFAAIQKLTGKNNPLKYIVASHHHDDHLSGMKEAFDLGANFIAHPAHVDKIRDRAKVDIPNERFVLTEDVGAFAGGAIKVFDFPNGHATHNLMTYVPSAKLLFTADFYGSRQIEGAPGGHEGLYKLQSKLSDLGLPVERFAAAHSARVMSATDFNYSLNNISKTVCPSDWSICKL
jgi:glyoxylase-like metal-dependent hydrolase (beta-lactamase superfamily II)